MYELLDACPHSSSDLASLGHLPPGGRFFDTLKTKPPFRAAGFTTYSCKNCDDEYVADYTDKLAHEYDAVVTDATCLTMGYTTYTCECGETYKADYTYHVKNIPNGNRFS